MNKSIVCFIFLIWMLTTFSISWLTRSVLFEDREFNKTTIESIQFLSSAPKYVVETCRQLFGLIRNEPFSYISERSNEFGCQIDLNFPCPDDDGYLLLSGLHPETRKGYIELIQISDGRTLKKWFPDWEQIINKLTLSQYKTIKNHPIQPLAINPLINKNGDLVFVCTESIVTIKNSAGNQYIISRVPAHHSIEFSNDYQYYITPGYASNAFEFNLYLSKKINWCDSLLKLSLDGSVVENLPFYKILEKNNLGGIVFGRSGIRELNEDLIHINQISVAPSDGTAWLKNDLLISARHLSEIFLYRPTEDRILWHRAGAWKNQHSAHFVSTNQIALFDNNVFGYQVERSKEYNFVSTNDINRIFLLRFSKDGVTELEPFKDLLELKCVRPQTITQGRARVLPDGGLFIEETNFGRHFRFSKFGVLWIRNNKYDQTRNGVLSWSRYYTKEEGLEVLQSIGVK